MKPITTALLSAPAIACIVWAACLPQPSPKTRAGLCAAAAMADCEASGAELCPTPDTMVRIESCTVPLDGSAGAP